jgi:hypothetical protein
MQDSQPNPKGRLFALNARPEPDDEEKELPDSSAPYQAHARPSNKPVYSLHCCLGKNGYRSFQYVHFDSDSRFQMTDKGHAITLRFIGTRMMQVRIVGRNLWRLYDLLHQHRVPWVMQVDRDFREGKEPVITAIEIEEFKGI